MKAIVLPPFGLLLAQHAHAQGQAPAAPQRVGGPPNFIARFVDGLITELSAERR